MSAAGGTIGSMADESPVTRARSLFDDLAAEQLREPAVALGRSFSAEALTVDGKIFAFVKGDRLVVKLPEERVERLVSSGRAVPFESGGRRMREWAAVRLPEAGDDAWPALAGDARAYVAAVAASAPKRRGGRRA
jgi:TfoX/Sxy family transcriptional regulator of competence genes